MSYGVPYMGSKNLIARWVVDHLPAGRRLVDLFAGGCAVSHAAALSGKYDVIWMNDVNDTPRLFMDAAHGRFKNERRWISREDFFRLKDREPYVRCCWSFGNNGNNYLYSQEIEPYKQACHYAIVFDEWAPLRSLCPEVCGAVEAALQGVTDRKARRVGFGQAVVRALKAVGDASLLERNPLYKSCKRNRRTKMQSLESLERLQSLESLERLQRIDLG